MSIYYGSAEGWLGLGFALVIWAVIGGIVAGGGGLVFAGLAAFFTRGVEVGRKRFIWVAGLFPAMCLVWVGGVFVLQGTVDQVVFHRDPGLGDAWSCPLPNGYALLMIDTKDQGFVYNPQTQPRDTIAEQEDAVGGVRVLQVAGRYLLGGSDSHGLEDGGKTGRIDSYF